MNTYCSNDPGFQGHSDDSATPWAKFLRVPMGQGQMAMSNRPKTVEFTVQAPRVGLSQLQVPDYLLVPLGNYLTILDARDLKEVGGVVTRTWGDGVCPESGRSRISQESEPQRSSCHNSGRKIGIRSPW